MPLERMVSHHGFEARHPTLHETMDVGRALRSRLSCLDLPWLINHQSVMTATFFQEEARHQQTAGDRRNLEWPERKCGWAAEKRDSQRGLSWHGAIT